MRGFKMQDHRRCVGTTCNEDPGWTPIPQRAPNQGLEARKTLKLGLRAWRERG